MFVDETIVFLGSQSSGTSRDAIKAAEEMGYFIVLLTNKETDLKEKKSFFKVQQIIYIEDLLNLETIVNELDSLETKGKKVKAILSFIDPFVSLAAQLTNRFGLVTLTVDALKTMEDKWCSRERLKNNPSTPYYSPCSIEKPVSEMIHKYHKLLPLVVKSPRSSGSKDVLLVETEQDFIRAISYFKRKKLNSHIIIEEYIDGPQYLVEVFVCHFEVSIVAIIDQEVSSFNRFIITGYGIPTHLSTDAQETLTNVVKKIVNDMGLEHGTCHLELRFVNGKWKLIEINPRMAGGAMNRIIYEATGINLAKETLKLYLGKELSLNPIRKKHVFAQFVTVHSAGRLLKIKGIPKAKNYDGIKEVYVKPSIGAILTPPLSMGNRYAYVIASSDNSFQAKKMAKLAAKEIKFYLEPF